MHNIIRPDTIVGWRRSIDTIKFYVLKAFDNSLYDCGRLWPSYEQGSLGCWYSLSFFQNELTNDHKYLNSFTHIYDSFFPDSSSELDNPTTCQQHCSKSSSNSCSCLQHSLQPHKHGCSGRLLGLLFFHWQRFKPDFWELKGWPILGYYG